MMDNHLPSQMLESPIYHLVPTSYYQCQPKDQPYRPANFAQEGFVHCTSGQTTLLEVANRYFATLDEPLLALEIEPTRLTAALKFEPPISPTGHQPSDNRHGHSDPPLLFPHIYGPIEWVAISNCFPLVRDQAGRWTITTTTGFTDE